MTPRAIVVGSLLVVLISVGAPYGNMIIRGSYMALDFSAVGALFLLFLVAGIANTALRAASAKWALTTSELIVIYIMMLIACSICTMGLGEQILPIISACSYYATPENGWADRILPHVRPWLMPQDAEAIKYFYEGLPRGMSIPWRVWLKPMLFWGVFIMALYFVMICMMVIIRRQWIARERLVFPLTRVPLEMVLPPDRGTASPFFRNGLMWLGFAIPFAISTIIALHNYTPYFPNINLVTQAPIFRGTTTLRFRLSFPIVGFVYLINLDIAFSLWFFNLVALIEKGTLAVLGVEGPNNLGTYGANRTPLLAHQGMGAMAVLVICGLWMGRRHLWDVARKATVGAEDVDDSDEIMSYRTAFWGMVLGTVVMCVWQWCAGMSAIGAVGFVLLALLIFFGLTRVVVEGGVAEAVAPSIAAPMLVAGTGIPAVGGPTGLTALAFGYVWSSDIRTFVMAACANGLRLAEDVQAKKRRNLFWAIMLAIVLSIAASVGTIMVLAYRHGGINLNTWFFQNGPQVPFKYVAERMKLGVPAGDIGIGWLHKLLGAAVMTGLMIARYRVLWWPFHPLGYAIGCVWIMDQIWLSIFIAWLLKALILKYGGPKLFQKLRPFFLGLILGQFVVAGMWLAIDYFTGMTDNRVFWI